MAVTGGSTGVRRRKGADVVAGLRAEGVPWWEIAAVLRRRLGVNARAAMRLAHGYSQREVAEEWSRRWPDDAKNLQAISRWESWPQSGHMPSLVVLDRLAQIYQCRIADLVADLGRHRPGDQAGDRTGRDTGEAGMERRTFMGGAAATAATATLHQPPLPPGAAEQVGLRRSVARATRLERAAQYQVLEVTLPTLLAEVTDAGVPALVSQVQALRAWHLIKQDLCTAAAGAASDALAAADRAGDPVLVGAALRCLGEVQLRAGRYAMACDLAIEAVDRLRTPPAMRRDTLAVQGASYLTAAVAQARAGQRHGTDELLRAATACADDLGEDTDHPAVFGPTNVAVHRVATAVELGNPTAALHHAQRATHLAGSPPAERHSRYLIDIARAHAQLDDDTATVHHLLTAEAIAPEEVHSHRLTHALLTDLLARERTSRTPELRPLATRCGTRT